jgi:citrate lyase subunit beta/citryl-CoA lyase
MPADEYLLRSLLFAPGHNVKMLTAAAAAGADAVAPDLEDSVAPAANKAVARRTVRELAMAGRLGTQPLFPRVNDRESGELVADVTALTVAGVSGFVYPKAQSGEDIADFAALLETIEAEQRLAAGRFKVIALIETTAAVLSAREICRASDRVIAVGFGGEDFLVDLHGRHDAQEAALATPRALIAMAARASGVLPLDTVHTDVHDLDGLARKLSRARRLGFAGAMAMHPKELPVLHELFSPSADEVRAARAVLDLAVEAARQGAGVAVINGRFIGPPTVAAARQLLRKHALITDRCR